jgi:hypothetical protein
VPVVEQVTNPVEGVADRGDVLHPVVLFDLGEVDAGGESDAHLKDAHQGVQLVGRRIFGSVLYQIADGVEPVALPVKNPRNLLATL